MIKLEYFSGKEKKVLPQLEQFLANFPSDYDVNNIKITHTTTQGGFFYIIVLYKAL